MLVRATSLCHFMPGAPLALKTDASDFAVGGVLEQWVQGIWQLLAFYSSRFKPSQAELHRPMPLADHKRSVTDRELLAAYRSVMHFQHFLEGRQFTLFTDHKPLVAIMAKISDTRSAMQARHLAAISEFMTEVQHLEGKVNVVAGTLSRAEIYSAMSTLGIDFRELERAQQKDPEVGAVRTAITNLRLQDVEICSHMLLCDVSQGHLMP